MDDKNRTTNNLAPQSATPDPAIALLKLEIETLEAEIVELEMEKYGILKLFFAFQKRFNEELDELSLKVMAMQMDELRVEAASNPKKKKDLDDIEIDYEKFQKYCGNDFEKMSEPAVSENDKTEMKKMFRRGSKLCHPDLVHDEHKQQAKAVFQRFQKAYVENDMTTLSSILDELEKGMFVECASESGESEMLVIVVKQLRMTASELEREIAVLKLSDNYDIISMPQKWDAYFLERKNTLTTMYNELKDAKKRRKNAN